MVMQSINPASGDLIREFATWNEQQLDETLQSVSEASIAWRQTGFSDRAQMMKSLASELKANKQHYAELITTEMGKPVSESIGEVEKCALACEFYADHAEEFLADETIESDAGNSYVAYQPLGTVLAVMPWNFPLWQVYRFAAPALMAGNTGVLKHASNVPQCAMAIEESFRNAGFPENVFRTLMIPASMVKSVIDDHRIAAVTLTGSEVAGREVASNAGNALKKSVLELGGSDAFVVLDDADLDLASEWGVKSRYQNGGQSCIAAKRFIVIDAIADDFLALFKQKASVLAMGNPIDKKIRLGPMSRTDLRDDLHKQVMDSIDAGATPVLGCEIPAGDGSFYPPSIIDNVKPGMRAYEEELFGPVAIFIRVKDEEEALQVANDSRYGLGASVWTRDSKRGEKFALGMQSGCTFINGMVKSDPRLPFGGVKSSGYGRELSHHGIREFVNAKTVWIR